MFKLKTKVLPLALILTFVLCGPALAQTDEPPAPQPLILSDDKQEYPLGLYLDILEDPSGELTIEDVSSPEFDSQFVPSQVTVSNYGFTDSVYWVRFRLENQTRQTNEWLLEQGFANTQFIDLYTPLPNDEGFSVKQTGVFRPPSTRDITYPRIVFNLTIPPESQDTFYLRFQNGAAMTLSLTLWMKDVFLVNSQTEQIIHGLFYGILIGLLFYNLFLLLFSFREASSLYYVTFLASFIFFLASYDGYMQIYFYFNRFSLAQDYIPLSWALIFISTVLFANDFLKIKSNFQRIYRANFVILGVWGLLIVLIPLTSYHVMTLLMAPWALLSMAAVLIAGVISLQKGFKAARFFLIAWLGLLVTLSMVILVRFGVLPSTIFSENAFRLGLVWMTVCWSIALADRFNLLKTEKEQANLELQASETRHRMLLETMNDGFAMINWDNRITYVNHRFAEMLGYPEEEITGHFVTELMDEDNQQIFHSQIERRKTGESAPYELSWQNKDGAETATIVSPMPLIEDNGGYMGSYAVITDITERVQAERNLEQRVNERTRELATLLEISRDISATQDLDGILSRILEKLNSVVDYHALVILSEQKDKWEIIAQDWSSNPAQQSDIDLSLSEIQGVIKELEAEKMILVDTPRSGIPNINGFGRLIDKLSMHSTTDIHCWLGLPLMEKGFIIGVMILGCEEVDQLRDQTNVIETFANQVAIVLENNRLYQQFLESVSEEERNRLANELHDSVTQTLFTASVLAEATPRIWDKDQELALQNLSDLNLMLRGALAEMRSLLVELRSGDLHGQTLEQLITSLVEAAQGRSPIEFNVSIQEVPGLEDKMTLAIYRITREALNNIIVHSGASQVKIILHKPNQRIELQIQDNGHGFDPQIIHKGHLGIKIMHERTAEIGGDLSILSEPGRGTDIILRWPGGSGERTSNG